MWCGFKCVGPVPLSGLNVSKLAATGGEKPFSPKWDDSHSFERSSRLAIALEPIKNLATNLPVPVRRIGLEILLRIQPLQGLFRLSDRREIPCVIGPHPGVVWIGFQGQFKIVSRLIIFTPLQMHRCLNREAKAVIGIKFYGLRGCPKRLIQVNFRRSVLEPPARCKSERPVRHTRAQIRGLRQRPVTPTPWLPVHCPRYTIRPGSKRAGKGHRPPDCLPACAEERAVSAADRAHRQGRHDRVHQFVLQCEYVIELSVVAVGPDMRASLHVDQLGGQNGCDCRICARCLPVNGWHRPFRRSRRRSLPDPDRRNVELRATTSRDLKRLNSVMMSSVNPSEK